MIEAIKIKYVIVEVCFQSHVDKRKCYLPCGVLVNCCILKLPWEYTGKHPGEN